MVFKIAMLIAMLVGPYDPPVLAPIDTEKNYISAVACEDFRASKEFTEKVAELRTHLLKEFENSSISIATMCVPVDTKPKLRSGAN
jgi:hypothetical protein